MVTIADLQQLISGWSERLSSQSQPSAYKDALSECIYDLNQLINHSIEEELAYRDMLHEADEYFSNLEPEDYAAA